ncbi:putative merozoite capping protein-1 [Erysiphe necator]|uniref:thioredoxin-dependent peroxiredoxin n=1 Tax=Uncinula necator TaxID=52586 RepID=A0A0B1PHS7_UNCNE|nr:putative merozoite capping protein-1 [Erysiphe necator]
MPSVLRKRKSPAAQPAAAEPIIKKKKKSDSVRPRTNAKKSVAPPLPDKTYDKTSDEERAKNVKVKSLTRSQKVAVGDTITLEGFGGEVETHEGEKTTLLKLANESKKGVVLFTYPKASTPGCTTQACLFRDQYDFLTSTGFSIYGLSKDSNKANTNFKTKQKLPYTLLCDPSAALIKAIGLSKAPSGITRGIFIIDKSGKVLAAQAGNPVTTVNVVKNLVESDSSEIVDETSAEISNDIEKSNESNNADEANSKSTGTADEVDA